MQYENTRMSKHFVLSDFMVGHRIYTSGIPLPAEELVLPNEEAIDECRAFLANVVEPMIERLGPCSISYGWSPEILNNPMSTPHRWSRRFGAAGDFAFHDWVNAGRAPIQLMNELRHIDFERFISYAGSEFVCLSHKTAGNRQAVYENVRTPGMDKPPFKSWSSKAGEARRWPAEFPERPAWRREEGEPVFHTCRTLRAQHIRVSRYFTLLDFCRSERGLAYGVNFVPPLNATPVIEWARRMGEVLDQVVLAVGRVSVTMGVLPRSLMDHVTGPPLHTWGPGPEQQCVRFLIPEGVDPKLVSEAMVHPSVAKVRYREHASGTFEFGVLVLPFDVAKRWSSARPAVRERRRAA